MRVIYVLIVLACLNSYAHAQSLDSGHVIVVDRESFKPSSAGPLRYPAGKETLGSPYSLARHRLARGWSTSLSPTQAASPPPWSTAIHTSPLRR